MYDSFRDELMKRDLSNTENYDRAIFTVSTAFLGASIVFINFVVPFEQAICIPLLILTWVALVLAPSASILAYRLGNKAIRLKLKQAQRYYKQGDESAFQDKNKYENQNDRLNLFAGASLIVAMILLVIFVSINITTEAPTMAKEISWQNSVTAKKSANVPTMEKIPRPGENVRDSANVPTMEQVPNTTTTSQGNPSTDK